MDDELKAILRQLVGKVEGIDAKIDAVDARLGAKIDAVDARLSAQINAVDTRLSALDTKVEQLRHVTSANHFKVVGRIDQVASMLAEHMADHDHGPADQRRA